MNLSPTQRKVLRYGIPVVLGIVVIVWLRRRSSSSSSAGAGTIATASAPAPGATYAPSPAAISAGQLGSWESAMTASLQAWEASQQSAVNGTSPVPTTNSTPPPAAPSPPASSSSSGTFPWSPGSTITYGDVDPNAPAAEVAATPELFQTPWGTWTGNTQFARVPGFNKVVWLASSTAAAAFHKAHPNATFYNSNWNWQTQGPPPTVAA